MLTLVFKSYFMSRNAWEKKETNSGTVTLDKCSLFFRLIEFTKTRGYEEHLLTRQLN